MAVTFNGVKNGLPANQLPDGYTRPTVTEIPASEVTWSNRRTYNINKADVENATASTTMTNILSDATYGLAKLIDDDLDNDFIATNTVTGYAILNSLTTNQTPENESGSSEWLTTTAEQYQCVVTVYVKVA